MLWVQYVLYPRAGWFVLHAAAATLVFLLLRVAPGDPIDALLGPKAPEQARAEVE